MILVGFKLQFAFRDSRVSMFRVTSHLDIALFQGFIHADGYVFLGFWG